MADVLAADVFNASDLAETDFSSFDLIGIGSGIYFGRHHRSVRHLVNQASQLPQQAFIFSTAGLPFLHLLFHLSLRRSLNRRGAEVIGEFSCRGWDTVGPLFLFGGLNRRHPNARDLERARDFARQIDHG